ncbi:hypothetical protein D6829_00625 [Candidatus Pacearchaeota archaeon]|nr:MAG: hypothetical protein D6829_00625 [Candidatus Pacearchaeota archaeon]
MKKESKKILKRWVFVFFVTALIVYGVWFFLFRYVECSNFSCFNERLRECKPTVFVSGDKMVYEYRILGPGKDGCDVNVLLLQAELEREDSSELEGKEMVCTVPKGVVALPESDIDACHGLLKESLQDRIIQKLHNYIAQNIGKINLGVVKPPKVNQSR